MSHQRLDLLAATDRRLEQSPDVLLLGTRNDPSHAERRCQQRGISLTKIRIALAYGRCEIHHHLARWTLVSRQLRRSPYARFEHDLNGLQLIGRFHPSALGGRGMVQLKTCKWNYHLRRH